jgi:hypothetical protein
MCRNIPAIFAISALVVLILCSACVLPGSESQVNVGLSQVTTPEISQYINFEEAKQEYESYSFKISGETSPVYHLFARDVDGSGNALTWLFGVRQGSGTRLLMYDRTGWKIIPWNATLPSEEIILNQIMSPNTLFSQNKQVLSDNSSSSTQERRDLELKEGTYRVTIDTGSMSRTLTFNATTGVLITGNV